MSRHRKGIVSAAGLMLAAASVAAGGTRSVAERADRRSEANQELAQTVAAVLNHSGQLHDFNIDIEAVDGMVALRGSVATATQRATADRLVQTVPGVLTVKDQIEIQAQPALLPALYQAPVERVTPGAGAGPTAPAVEQVQPRAAAVGPAIAPPVPEHVLGPGLPQYAWPNLPQYAWPSYAPYPNYSAVGYPTCYPSNAWPYIGPFYPYPEVPLGWRDVHLQWKDGVWWLKFSNCDTLVGSMLHGVAPMYGHGHGHW